MLLAGAGALVGYAEPRRARIEEELGRLLQPCGGRPAVLHEALRYAVVSGGKRLRPLLCVTAAEVCGRTLEDVLPAACALELIHTQSLVHDDLPAIDDDAIRRGKATCHVRFGEAVAILAGDALLVLAFEIFATQRRLTPAARVLDAMELLARAIGREGMAGGEVLDILSEGKAGDLETLELIHDRRAGELIRASLLTGAILCGASPELVERLSVFGSAIGHAFQIVDDILGESGDPAHLGKPVGRDTERRKLTYPRLLGTKRSREIATAKAEQALRAIEGLGPAAAPLHALGLYALHRTK